MISHVLRANSPNLFSEGTIKNRGKIIIWYFSSFFHVDFMWQLHGAGFETLLGASIELLFCLLTA